MILTGAIQSTHYNLIDTFITLIPQWDEYVSKMVPIIKKNENYLVRHCDNSLITMSLIRFCDFKEVQNILPFDTAIRFTIVECMVWGYVQGYRVG